MFVGEKELLLDVKGESNEFWVPGPFATLFESLLQPRAYSGFKGWGLIPTRNNLGEFSGSWVLVLFVGNETGALTHCFGILPFFGMLTTAKKGNPW